MFSIKQLIILSAMMCVAFCAIHFVSPQNGNSKTKEGFCEYNGEFIKQGETKQKGECSQIKCNNDYSIILER